VTTFEPGASDVFTHGLRCRPRASALRARIPAPTITDGFDVLVQHRDRGDHDVAVVERERLASDGHAPGGCRCAAASTVPPSGSCGWETPSAPRRGPARWRAGSEAG